MRAGPVRRGEGAEAKREILLDGVGPGWGGGWRASRSAWDRAGATDFHRRLDRRVDLRAAFCLEDGNGRTTGPAPPSWRGGMGTISWLMGLWPIDVS